MILGGSWRHFFFDDFLARQRIVPKTQKFGTGAEKVEFLGGSAGAEWPALPEDIRDIRDIGEFA